VRAGLDTSVVVRLLTGEPEPLAREAMTYLAERRGAGDVALVSDWVLAETYHALQHHFGIPKKEVLDALRDFLSSPGIEGTGEVPGVLETPDLESAKPGFIDRVIHRDYLRSGADEMVTFEKAASVLEGARVLRS
jgi:predicted nucleic acid-binding protein